MMHLFLVFQTVADIMDQGLPNKITFAGGCLGMLESDEFALAC